MCGRFCVDQNIPIEELKSIIEEADRKIREMEQQGQEQFKMHLGEIFPTNIVPTLIANKLHETLVQPMQWGFAKFNGPGVIINARISSLPVPAASELSDPAYTGGIDTYQESAQKEPYSGTFRPMVQAPGKGIHSPDGKSVPSAAPDGRLLQAEEKGNIQTQAILADDTPRRKSADRCQAGSNLLLRRGTSWPKALRV